MKKAFYVVSAVVSVGLILGSYLQWLPLSMVEVLGFITGGACVWLTVVENIWNWPIGIVNSAFFLILFWRGALYADASLQIVYIVLGFLGWYWWLYGGKEKTELRISHASPATLMILAAVTVIATYAFTVYLRTVNDAAPFLDALTTVISLVAQYLLTKKFIESWYIWILADIIYIPLYAYKELYLTAVIYAVFMVMCFMGLKEWKRLKNAHEAVAPALRPAI